MKVSSNVKWSRRLMLLNVSRTFLADTVLHIVERLAWNLLHICTEKEAVMLWLSEVLLLGVSIKNHPSSWCCRIMMTFCVWHVYIHVCILHIFCGFFCGVYYLLAFRAQWWMDVQCSRWAVLSYHLEAQTGCVPLLLALWFDRKTQGAAFG